MMKPLNKRMPKPENTSSVVLLQGIKMPTTPMIIMPIRPMKRKPRRPEKSTFAVQPTIAVAVNIRAVVSRAFVRRTTPPGEEITKAINGARVAPLMRANKANKKRLIGVFVLHMLEVKMRINSAPKRIHIRAGVWIKRCMK